MIQANDQTRSERSLVPDVERNGLRVCCVIATAEAAEAAEEMDDATIAGSDSLCLRAAVTGSPCSSSIAKLSSSELPESLSVSELLSLSCPVVETEFAWRKALEPQTLRSSGLKG